ncbi:MAG: response regulator transcription factor [Flavobacteriales bacterium]|nr:response regulator transcription factor [Flavobacteriales bacterium]
MNEYNVALVDDHHLVRSGLEATVNGLGGYRVTIEVGNGQELIEALERADPPDIAIVDLNMPVMDGYATIAWLREHHPAVRPLALTFDATDAALVKAVRAGARGFLLKDAQPRTLKNALDSLMLTGYYYTDTTHDVLQRHPEMKTREECERERILQSITPREMEFLKLVCDEDEFTYEQIAQQMGIHHRTVDNFRIALFTKFHIKSKTGLVLFAMRWGLL